MRSGSARDRSRRAMRRGEGRDVDAAAVERAWAKAEPAMPAPMMTMSYDEPFAMAEDIENRSLEHFPSVFMLGFLRKGRQLMFIVSHSKSRHFFPEIFIWHLASPVLVIKTMRPLPLHSSFSLAIPTLFNACARPAHHVLHVTKTRVPMSGSTQEQYITGPN